MEIYLIVISIMSLLTFILYVIDKIKAKLNTFRISEKALLTCSILGGAIGGILAMMIFRHKTKHTYFIVTNVIGLVIVIGLGVFIYLQFGFGSLQNL